ncbi:MAG: transposase [Candidatus Thiodiazotropha endolucinida]
MSEIITAKTPTKRRRFSKTFKAKIVAACHQPGASVAGVALANGLNANLVHRWRRAAKTKTKVHWPLTQIDRAIPWLRALQA